MKRNEPPRYLYVDGPAPCKFLLPCGHCRLFSTLAKVPKKCNDICKNSSEVKHD